VSARAAPDLLLGILPIALILALWQALTSLGMAPPALLPPPMAVFRRLIEQFGNPIFVQHTLTTLFRLFAGFTIACVVGITLGLMASSSRVAESAIRPIVRVLAPVPKIALYPAFILILGFDHASKITLVVVDALFPILLATYHGAISVEKKLVWSARAAGTPPWQVLFKVVLPAASPSILTGCRIGLLISCIVVFLAEMISSTEGLGYLLVRAARSFQTADMFVPLIAISALGLILNGLLYGARRYLLRGFPDV
jgi:ABC-type nitrate/sulfonate/bicarbonate transport system permease component